MLSSVGESSPEGISRSGRAEMSWRKRVWQSCSDLRLMVDFERIDCGMAKFCMV